MATITPIADYVKNVINIQDNIYFYGFAIFLIIFCIVFSISKLIKFTNYIIPPYTRKENFISIYTVEEFDLNPKNFIKKLIPRTYEVGYLDSLFNIEFDKSIDKKALCLIGESGTGKSTIINIFKEKYKDKYDIFYFYTEYEMLCQKITEKYSKEFYHEAIEVISEESRNKKIIFIFDQFEIFFSIPKEAQEKFIKEFYNKLIMKNIAILFIIKSEKLKDFLSHINLEVYSQNRDENGLLYSLCKNKSGKNNSPNLIFIQSKTECSNSKISENRETNLRERCNKVFSNNHKVYNYVENSRIIEQQIILNIFENEKNNKYIEDLIDKSKKQNVMMYFERQLCSTNHHFEAMQIMYLLGLGRKSNIVLTDEQIREALFICKEDNYIVSNCLKKLTELHLVKQKEAGGNLYEVTHDYIAEKAIEYGNKELNTESRSILEFYIENYNNDIFKGFINKITRNKDKRRLSLKIALILAVIFVFIVFFYEQINEKSDYSICVSISAISSIFYGYGLYSNSYCLYPSKYRHILHCILIVIIPCLCVLYGILPNVIMSYNYFALGIASIGFASISLTIKNNMVKIARDYFITFGLKFLLVAVLIIFIGHFISIYCTSNMSTYLQFILYTIVVLYGYLSQLNKRYYYYILGMMSHIQL